MGRTLALCSGTLRTCPGCPHHSRDSGMGRTLALCSGTLGTCPGCPQHSWDSGMGRTVGLGRLGHVLDVPSIPGTLGWEGQLDWDAWDMSGMSPAFLGLWDGKDSWIGTLGTCLGCPQHSWDSRMGRLALCSGTLGTCLGRLQHSQDSGIGMSGTLQWDCTGFIGLS